MNTTRRPNIVITIADDQRHDLLAGLGHPQLQTPHLDRLMRRGMCFTHAHHGGSMHGAVCMPSRAMLHTGRYLYDIPALIRGDWGFQAPSPNPDPLAFPLLGELLRQAGYHNFVTGKWHNERLTLARSFNDGDMIFFGGMADHYHMPLHHFDPTGVFDKQNHFRPTEHSTDVFSKAAVDFLDRYDGDQPFFLYCAFTAPHDPRTTDACWHEKYPPESIQLPDNFMPEHPFDNGELRIRDEELEAFPRTPEAIRKHISDYYAMTHHMDAGIGRIHDALRRNGYDDNTIVIHTADHGLSVGQHGLLGKQNMYDHSVRVPLLIAGPDLPQNQRDDRLCYQHDIYPTVLRLAGITPPDDTFFRDLFQAPGYDDVFCNYRECQRMVRDRQHKLIVYRVDGRSRTQLFDLQNDPHELRDLSADQPEKVTAMRKRLVDWQEKVHDPAGVWHE